MSSVKAQMDAKKNSRSKRRYQVGESRATRAQWNDANAETMLELVEAASLTGGAVRLGNSRDGGAYAIGVYGDGPEPYTVYAANLDELEEHVSKLIDVFEAIAAER